MFLLQVQAVVLVVTSLVAIQLPETTVRLVGVLHLKVIPTAVTA